MRWGLGLTVAVLGCAAPSAGGPALPWASQRLPAADLPAASPDVVELGRLLFHDPVLSSDGTVACVTCHGQIWGLSDGLPVSVGVGGEGPAGTGRQGPNRTRRNSPTLWNVAFRSALMWDGRFSSLEEQVLGPLEDPIELGREPAALVAALGEIQAYRELFGRAFAGDQPAVTLPNLQYAIATFERTLVSSNAPYDRFVAGDAGALDDEAIAGMWLMDEVGCVDCHTPPRFDSDTYAAVTAPERTEADTGRYEVTGDPADRWAFRVPTLRNARETGPYFHDGSAPSVRAAVHDPTRPLSTEEADAIAHFIRKGLMDKSAEPDRPTAVPSGLPVVVDGYGIPR